MRRPAITFAEEVPCVGFLGNEPATRGRVDSGKWSLGPKRDRTLLDDGSLRVGLTIHA
jgi:hypothetical protein